MSCADFIIKKGDTLPSIQSYLLDEDGTAVNLTANSGVMFIFRPASTLVAQSGVATVVNATTALVQYNWVTGDTNTVGAMQAEWRVDFSGRKMTFPNNDYIDIDVIDNLT